MVCSHKASVLIAEITADRSPIVSRMSAAEEQFLLGACCIGTSTRVAVRSCCAMPVNFWATASLCRIKEEFHEHEAAAHSDEKQEQALSEGRLGNSELGRSDRVGRPAFSFARQSLPEPETRRRSGNFRRWLAASFG